MVGVTAFKGGVDVRHPWSKCINLVYIGLPYLVFKGDQMS